MEIIKKNATFTNDRGKEVTYPALYIKFNPKERQTLFDRYELSIEEVLIKTCRGEEGKFVRYLLDNEMMEETK